MGGLLFGTEFAYIIREGEADAEESLPIERELSIMLKSVLVASIMLSSVPAAAIRWDFDDGTTQGWSAKEAFIWGGVRELHLFRGVVEDGVWRIAVDPADTKGYYPDPRVELISSTIGYDSVLFDQVRIRLYGSSPPYGR